MAYSKTKREEGSQIDVRKAAEFLQRAFDWATGHLNKNNAGSDLHSYQCDFSWILRDITSSPNYIVPKHILSANELIDKIVASEIEKGHHYKEEELQRWRRTTKR